MRTFEVELKCTTYLTMTVEAETQTEAETKAWQELEAEDLTFALVEIESVEDITGQGEQP